MRDFKIGEKVTYVDNSNIDHSGINNDDELGKTYTVMSVELNHITVSEIPANSFFKKRFVHGGEHNVLKILNKIDGKL